MESDSSHRALSLFLTLKSLSFSKCIISRYLSSISLFFSPSGWLCFLCPVIHSWSPLLNDSSPGFQFESFNLFVKVLILFINLFSECIVLCLYFLTSHWVFSGLQSWILHRLYLIFPCVPWRLLSGDFLFSFWTLFLPWLFIVPDGLFFCLGICRNEIFFFKCLTLFGKLVSRGFSFVLQ